MRTLRSDLRGDGHGGGRGPQARVGTGDELAHTNIPGSVHEKRWQSVDDILAAGINVISTVNVQHFESLNDTVFEITGVRVRETLPDSVLDRADEVVLVDLTADALINRLNRGVVYDLDKIPGALSNFFRKGNLVALRELALRKTAEEVDESLQDYIDEHEIERPWATEDRVVVCVKVGPGGQEARAPRLPHGQAPAGSALGRARAHPGGDCGVQKLRHAIGLSGCAP